MIKIFGSNKFSVKLAVNAVSALKQRGGSVMICGCINKNGVGLKSSAYSGIKTDIPKI